MICHFFLPLKQLIKIVIVRTKAFFTAMLLAKLSAKLFAATQAFLSICNNFDLLREVVLTNWYGVQFLIEWRFKGSVFNHSSHLHYIHP